MTDDGLGAAMAAAAVRDDARHNTQQIEALTARIDALEERLVEALDLLEPTIRDEFIRRQLHGGNK